MKISHVILLLTTCTLPISVLAGGDPDFVKFPQGYKSSDTHYTTVNRQNGKQVASLYANDIAIDSIKAGGAPANGSRIIMEVYKLKKDENDKPIMGADGIYEKGKFAAIAVMEKRSDWAAEFPAEHRAGGWGFALYDPQGNPKANELECASCHQPLSETGHMFTYDQLK